MSRDVQRRYLSGLAIVTAAVVIVGYAAIRPGHSAAAHPAAAPPSVIPASASPRLPVLEALAATAPQPDPTALGSLIGGIATRARVGGQLVGTVVDVDSGATLWSRGAAQSVPPASTTKLLTAAAALRALGAAHRFLTSTRRAGNLLYLVGGGDPTLLRTPRTPAFPAYPQPATLAALARATVAALPKGRRFEVRFDSSGWSGPKLAAGWSDDYLTEGDITPPSPLELDEGRLNPADPSSPRTSAPAMQAAAAFARLLRRDGLKLRGGIAPARPPAAAVSVARIHSPPLGLLVQRMLTVSDNDLAEALGRAVALHDRLPGTFAGAAAAVTRQAEALGAAHGAVSLQDVSGLSHRDRIAPAALIAVLRAAASPRDPQLRPIIEGLPVAGMTGTLAGRYRDKRTRAAAGVVRAKTGTLTGVNALAGLVVDSSGRLLAFALLASHAKAPEHTEQALDEVVASVATCGCAAAQ